MEMDNVVTFKLENVEEFKDNLYKAMEDSKDDTSLTVTGTFTKTESEDEIYNKNVVLIMGKHNATNQTFFWKNDLGEGIEIGDYAIVENKNDYDLVKIIAYVVTNEKYIKFMSKDKINKKVVKYIERSEIRED